MDWFSDSFVGAVIQFGHEQVIIVRDEEHKEKLPKELRGNIVLTVLESKGLEFEDVLVYNFFTDSNCGDDWRVINTYLTEMGITNTQTTGSSSPWVLLLVERNFGRSKLIFSQGKSTTLIVISHSILLNINYYVVN